LVIKVTRAAILSSFSWVVVEEVEVEVAAAVVVVYSPPFHPKGGAAAPSIQNSTVLFCS